MNHLHNQNIVGSTFVFSKSEQNYLGPDLEMTKCRIVLQTTARALTIARNVRLIDCYIEATKRLANFQMWCGAVIHGCTFSGEFSGNDFGHWEEQAPGGDICRCDFTEAMLVGCRFMDCDVETIDLPKWPCFAIIDPTRRGRDIESIEWPGKLRYWAATLLDEPHMTSAHVEHGPELAKQFGTTEDKLRSALDNLGDVIM